MSSTAQYWALSWDSAGTAKTKLYWCQSWLHVHKSHFMLHFIHFNFSTFLISSNYTLLCSCPSLYFNTTLATSKMCMHAVFCKGHSTMSTQSNYPFHLSLFSDTLHFILFTLPELSTPEILKSWDLRVAFFWEEGWEGKGMYIRGTRGVPLLIFLGFLFVRQKSQPLQPTPSLVAK